MHTQICPLTQGSRRGMARLKPLPPCAMYTLTSTFLILKFPTNSIQKNISNHLKIPEFLHVSLTSPGPLPFTPAVSPAPQVPPAVRTPDDRTNTKWLHRVDLGSSGRPHPARLPYAPGWGREGWNWQRVAGKKVGPLGTIFFGTPQNIEETRQKIHAKQLSILETIWQLRDG